MAGGKEFVAPWTGEPFDGNDRVLSANERMTGEAVALDVRPASFILRAAGTIIDWIAYMLLFWLLALAALWISAQLDDASIGAALIVSALVLSWVVVPVAVELLSHGRSLGKLAIGARIVRDDAGAVQFRHVFIRALVGVLEIFMTVGGIAALVGFLNPMSKRLGDLLAGTYSQHERVPQAPPSMLALPPQLAGWAEIADVARMPDRLSRRVAQFLRQAPQLTPVARMGLASELANEVVPYISPIPLVDPESLLVGVAVLRRDRDFDALMLERRRLGALAPVLGTLPHGFPNR